MTTICHPHTAREGSGILDAIAHVRAKEVIEFFRDEKSTDRLPPERIREVMDAAAAWYGRAIMEGKVT